MRIINITMSTETANNIHKAALADMPESSKALLLMKPNSWVYYIDPTLAGIPLEEGCDYDVCTPIEEDGELIGFHCAIVVEEEFMAYDDEDNIVPTGEYGYVTDHYVEVRFAPKDVECDECLEDDHFVDYPETHESAFVGGRLRSYYDHDAGEATFYPIDSHGHSKGRSIEVTLPYSKWADICRRIETTPDEYVLQVCKAYNGEEYGVVCHHLDEMPFDRYENGRGFIHATGWEYLESNGDWVNEYEDDTDDVSHIIVFQF